MRFWCRLVVLTAWFVFVGSAGALAADEPKGIRLEDGTLLEWGSSPQQFQAKGLTKIIHNCTTGMGSRSFRGFLWDAGGGKSLTTCRLDKQLPVAGKKLSAHAFFYKNRFFRYDIFFEGRYGEEVLAVFEKRFGAPTTAPENPTNSPPQWEKEWKLVNSRIHMSYPYFYFQGKDCRRIARYSTVGAVSIINLPIEIEAGQSPCRTQVKKEAPKTPEVPF